MSAKIMKYHLNWGKYYFDVLGDIILSFEFIEPQITFLIQQIHPANILESFTIESVDDSKSDLCS